MNRLPAQRVRPSYFRSIEEQIIAILEKLIFRPVLAVAQGANPQVSASAVGLQNAPTDFEALRNALRTGRMQYEGGLFSGETSAAIARDLRAIGASRDSRSGLYRLDPARVPAWVKAEAVRYHATAKGAHDLIRRKLDELQTNLVDGLSQHPVEPEGSLRAMEHDFRTTAKALEMRPELSPDSLERLAKDYAENMALYIKKFSDDMIATLRRTVEKNATEGYRFDRLVDGIKSRYSVAQNKAKFLARQETGLFMAKYRRERFLEAGVTRYEWSAAMDERTRDDHRRLNGQVFFYKQPPIVDRSTGRRGNPGEDFNCRCVDMPVLEPVRSAA